MLLISMCSFWLYGSRIVYPIINRLVPSLYRFETRRCPSLPIRSNRQQETVSIPTSFPGFCPTRRRENLGTRLDLSRSNYASKLYLFTFTVNKLQIQTTCKIAELIKAGTMETCLLPNIQYYSNDIKIYEITEINYTNEFKIYYSNEIKIQDIQ